ncbi:MAG: DNA-binding protein WhiA [Bacilli bacterium]
MNDQLHSFTASVKEELTTKPYDKDRQLAMFAGFVKANGRYVFSKRTEKLTLSTSYAKVAQLMYQIAKKVLHITPKFEYRQSPRFSQWQTYWIIFETKVSDILKAIHLDFDSSPEVYLKQFASVDAIAGYLSGLFLASGSVNHPSSSHYHLEMSSDDEDFLSEIQRLLKQVKSLRFAFKLRPRKGKYMLYLKKSDQIADFLIFMGATDATLEFENVRVARDFANSENRLQICENANMAKTIAAAKKQREAILIIDKVIGLDQLDHPKLEKLCRLRLKHDSSSLEELALKMSQHFQKPISKSQLNHLFRSVLALAKKLSGKA